jgi:hypothetical protein
MKAILKLTALSLLVLLYACGQKSHEHDGHDHDHAHDAAEASPNHALYEEVMKVHNEAMAKMDAVYRLREDLKKKASETPGLSAEKKKEMEDMVLKLDSANESMMTWMHEFKPEPDSIAGEEKVREYLETEMEKVKKVREDILEAIDRAKAL